jgi:hypothetical protein
LLAGSKSSFDEGSRRTIKLNYSFKKGKFKYGLVFWRTQNIKEEIFMSRNSTPKRAGAFVQNQLIFGGRPTGGKNPTETKTPNFPKAKDVTAKLAAISVAIEREMYQDRYIKAQINRIAKAIGQNRNTIKTRDIKNISTMADCDARHYADSPKSTPQTFVYEDFVNFHYKGFTPEVRMVFIALMMKADINGVADNITQLFIGNKLGISRKTVNKAIQLLQSKGFMKILGDND